MLNEQQIKDTIRDFLKTWLKGEVSKLLPLFTDESVWVNAQGTFTGVKQIETYLNWVYNVNKDMTISEIGVGLIVQAYIAIMEHELSGVIDGQRWTSPAICIWEFKDDKVAHLRTYVDVLDQARQLAKGPVEKMAVNAIIKASREGL